MADSDHHPWCSEEVTGKVRRKQHSNQDVDQTLLAQTTLNVVSPETGEPS